MVRCIPLMLLSLLTGCICQSDDSYESHLRYWRTLEYPRLEKLMSRYGSGIQEVWVNESEYQQRKGDPTDPINENKYPTIINYCTDVFGKPTILEITKRHPGSDGSIISRKARITVLGHLEWEEEYLDGKSHGIFRYWYSNGQLRAKTCYRHGAAHGTAYGYSIDGTLLGKDEFIDGKLISSWEVLDGKWTQTVSNGDGRVIDFDDKGQDAGFWDYINGEPVRGAH
jgi:antitoxin component YwqK of YwqJK toxin-antitoxin module